MIPVNPPGLTARTCPGSHYLTPNPPFCEATWRLPKKNRNCLGQKWSSSVMHCVMCVPHKLCALPTTRSFMNDCRLLLSRTFTSGYNHRNSLSKSGFCRRMRTNFLRVGAVELACTLPRPFCCCGPQPSNTTRKLSTDLEKSRDFVQTSRCTLGDNVTHCCNCFQCSRMLRTVQHLFLLVSSIFLHGSGRVLLTFTCPRRVVCENTPIWHSQCLSCMVIASAAISLSC